MPETRLSRSSRRTVSTFAVSGPIVTIDYTTPILFRKIKVVPFEVDLTWTNGRLDDVYVVRAWIMRNGTPRRAVTVRTNDWGGPLPMWLDDLIRRVTEPGPVVLADPTDPAEPLQDGAAAGPKPSGWEYNTIGCDSWHVRHLCNQWANDGDWEPVAVFTDRPDAEVPSEIGNDDSEPAEAVRPVQVLFRRLVPADDGDG